MTVNCKYCTEGVSGTNMSRHILKYHPEHYVSRASDKITTVNLQCRQVARMTKKPNDNEGGVKRTPTPGSEVSQLPRTSTKLSASSTATTPLFVDVPRTVDTSQTSSTMINPLTVDVSAPSLASSLSLGGSSTDVPSWSSGISSHPRSSPSSLITRPSTVQRGTPTDFLHGRLAPAMATMVTVAVQDLVESHHIYDAVNLGSAMSRNFPDIPADAVPYIVVAAASAAQHVARIHTMRELYMKSDSAERKAHAENALTSMMSWSFGLRRSSPPFAVPVAPPMNTVCQVIDLDPEPAGEEMHQKSPPRDVEGEKQPTPAAPTSMPMITDYAEQRTTSAPVPETIVVSSPPLENLQLPVTYQQSNQGFEELMAEVAIREVSGEMPRVCVPHRERRLASSSLYRTHLKTKAQVEEAPEALLLVRRTEEIATKPMAESGVTDVTTAVQEVKKPEDAKLEKTKTTVDSVAAERVESTETTDAASERIDSDTAVNVIEYVEITEVVESVFGREAARSVGVGKDTEDAAVENVERTADTPQQLGNQVVGETERSGGVTPAVQREIGTPATEKRVELPNVKTSKDLPLPDLQVPATFEDTRHSRSPKVVKMSSESNRTRSRSPIQRRWSEHHGDRKSSRAAEYSRRIEDNRRRSRSPRRARVPEPRSDATHHLDRRRSHSPSESVSSSRLQELLAIERSMKRRERDGKKN